MESKPSKVSKLIKKLMKEKNEWHILRYELLKSIHFEESHIRDDVDQSQRYFAYLLKSRLSQLELLRLIDSGFLSLAVQFFRNRLVTQALQQDLFKQIQKDINFSALKHKRKYSRKYSKIKNKLS